MREEHHWSWTN